MYEWKIDIILKSGKELTVYYRGYENSSGKVAEKTLTGDLNSLNGFSNKDRTKNILVKISEIAAASIEQA